ncbi:MAG TPA: nif-specific transcriptional activator NifA [Candidatus Competibacteraceae bacterium]|nr:nif-specific transcriptional activator NifA [Candidatus Competibacteraceae bacterium]HRZ07194.1 nif-specific transcriptional activator NifA [Candidatus Competibacteraceae bacterium]HSA47571.1 nif-specific transcriptional activator NifA [Candidatus Competibacteraceae bacterium]
MKDALMDRSALLDIELATLFQVSQILSSPSPLGETLDQVLHVLHEHGELHRGMVSLVDPDSGALLVNAVHGRSTLSDSEPIRYLPGEGVLGMVLERGEKVILPRLADEPRFLDRLRLYDRELPLISVPIRAGPGQYSGVLAAQPPHHDQWLPERARFLEMVANLIARSVRAAQEVERERRVLTAERDSLRRTVRGRHGFDSMVGHSLAMQRVFEQVRQVAKWNTTVLVRGESGTGKELVACAIHYNSPRAGGPLVKLNCAALPDNLLESELFGHEKGAFTGAVNQRKGRFEQAHGGTLFLDEIGDISPTFQAKLLRVLQEGELERVGSSQTLQVDVRIIAATNRDLETAVDTGEFREDLYYRLNVMPIFMPVLRERQEDIPDLARFLVDKIARQQGRRLTITDSAIRVLMRHPWPGNVREMENCLERSAIMSADGVIAQDVIELNSMSPRGASALSPLAPAADLDLDAPDIDERERVIAALEQAGWVQAKAARLLGMTPRQIAYRVQILNIKMRRL